VKSRIELVIWEDAAGDHGGWAQVEEFATFATGKFVVYATGFLTYEDENCIVLTLQFNDQNNTMQLSNNMRIPKSLILYRTELAVVDLEAKTYKVGVKKTK
jgi:hypothetical protein